VGGVDLTLSGTFKPVPNADDLVVLEFGDGFFAPAFVAVVLEIGHVCVVELEMV
jgi:hypothetical protein